MTPQHAGDDSRHRAIGEILALLDQAYEQTWTSSQFDPTRMDLGLGIYLVRAQACHALTPGQSVPESQRSGDTSVPSLLRTAEHLTRDLPLATGAPPNVADLVVALCDLICDADGIAW